MSELTDPCPICHDDGYTDDSTVGVPIYCSCLWGEWMARRDLVRGYKPAAVRIGVDPDEVLYFRDFERHLGQGKSLIFEGNPRHCPVTERHSPHPFYYRYRSSDGEIWRGEYHCDGWPWKFADRSEAG